MTRKEDEAAREASIEKLMSGIPDGSKTPPVAKDGGKGKDAEEESESDEEKVSEGSIVDEVPGEGNETHEPTDENPEGETTSDEREGVVPEATKADAHAERMDRLEKMLTELTGHIKSMNRSPEQQEYAKAYPHLADRHQEMAERAMKFADDTVGRDHADWHKIADGYMRNISDAEKKPEAAAPAAKPSPAKPKDEGAKKPKAASPISKPAPKAQPKGRRSDEELIDLLQNGR